MSGRSKKERRTEGEVVEVAVAPIIGAEEFAEARALQRARSPLLKAPPFGGVCFCYACGAMTLGTGRSGQYRYYTCSAKARQGQTGCRGDAIPMGVLDDLIVSHLEDWLTPEGLADLLGDVLVSQDVHLERLKGQVATLQGQMAEAEAKLSRLYEAIEMGLAYANDPNLKGRLTELAGIRDAALVGRD